MGSLCFKTVFQAAKAQKLCPPFHPTLAVVRVVLSRDPGKIPPHTPGKIRVQVSGAAAYLKPGRIYSHSAQRDDMEFLFPHNTIKAWKGPVQTRDRKYFVRDLPAMHMTCGAGTLVVQRRDHDSFYIQMQVLQCHRPFALTPYVRQTRVVLFYMLDGGFGYRLHRNLRVNVRAGSYCLFVLPGGSSALPELWPAPGRYASFLVEFTPSFFKDVLKDTAMPDVAGAPGTGKTPRSMMVITPGIRSIIGALRHSSGSEPEQSLYRDIRVRMLLLRYLRDSRRPGGISPATLQLIEDMDLYIREHLGDALTVQALAQQFFLSRATLERYFLQYYGVTVHRYILQQRLIWARELLQLGKTVSTAALETGFRDLSSFARAFKQYYGHPPSHFKKT